MRALAAPCAVAAAVVALVGGAPTVRAAIIADPMGNTSFVTVHDGYNPGESLAAALASYVNPNTQLATPITRPDGMPIITGNVDRGENPALSDQLSYQRFLVTGQDATLTITYPGIGRSDYRDVLGIYTYDSSLDPATAPLTMVPLLVRGMVPPGAAVAVTVPAGRAFGFYVSADGQPDRIGQWFSESFRNTDGQTDHFFFLHTNIGMMLTAEDLPFNAATGRLGDADYEDVMVTLGFGPTLLSEPPPLVPEPASVALIALGAVAVLRRRRLWV